ncbi:MAG: ECF transporter S component [Oscillospiraceae bacterium]
MSTETLAAPKKFDIHKMVALSMLIAILIVFDVTGIGFIHVPPISITIMQIPVLIGAVVLGPGCGAILGGTFGILSMWEATTKGVSPMDLAFSPFLSGSPISSLIMALGCRILFGLVAGLLFQWLSKHDKAGIWSLAVTSIASCLFHTVSVLGSLWLLFPNLQTTFKSILIAITSVNFLVEVGLSFVFALAFAKIIPILKRKAHRPKLV